ncbi:succinylglutamate desuccinylase/aspartoacylase family protein [Halobacteria archaeon AArc-curdl1]|uniref:Succinylglutamate desuccinylase/aspartoacylase family protein n=1 Tax=Natronosalvus hydrolyticus TaxID=2979988 RepID=A0AAP2Z954_9EURY|nr:succinylglutamate desuccinylase/aspartoacylase family protein [Halobacteria archaeon AArc-curdl1]
MQIGTATAEPGELEHGYLEVTDLPTGGSERLPVTIACGEQTGPTLWVTGGVHGNESTGIAAVQDVLGSSVPEGLSGTVVCMPMCNPAGIRRTNRHSYYHDDDPNRFFPATDAGDSTGRRVQELIDERLYETIVESADALLDLHTAQVGSEPFVIRDRVLYGEARTESEATALAARLEDFARATALPMVNEYPATEYADRNLHRSNAGAVLNEAGIPALTFELGSHHAIEDPYRAAGVAGVYGAMVHLEMLPEMPAVVQGETTTLESPVSYPVRRFVGPRASVAGFCRPQVETGVPFEAGDAIADIVSPHGTVRESLEAPHDGYVLGWRAPTTYENDAVASLAIRDEGDLVVPRS